jgi:hypothetical protein
MKSVSLFVATVLSLTPVVGCEASSNDALSTGSDALESSGGEINVQLMEIPHASLDELIQTSAAVVTARLASVGAGPEVPAQAEDRSETVREMVVLEFSVEEVHLGSLPPSINVLWPGFDRSKEGRSKIVLNGADLQSLNSTQDVLLFVREDGDHWVINSTDGIWRVLPNGKIQSPFRDSDSAVRQALSELTLDELLQFLP